MYSSVARAKTAPNAKPNTNPHKPPRIDPKQVNDIIGKTVASVKAPRG